MKAHLQALVVFLWTSQVADLFSSLPTTRATSMHHPVIIIHNRMLQILISYIPINVIWSGEAGLQGIKAFTSQATAYQK